MSEWLPILIFPACALLAVVVIALVQKGKELDDHGLLLSFAVLFSVALLLAMGLLRTQWAQTRLDPTLELAAQLQAHPVIVALEQFHGDDPVNDRSPRTDPQSDPAWKLNRITPPQTQPLG